MSKINTKERIVETASQLFYKKGYNLTGINEIIAEAGIAKATLYSHFKSKEDICLAYLQSKNVTFMNDLSAYCASKRPGPNRVVAIFDFLQDFFEDNDFNGCWCIRTVSEIPKDNERVRTEIQNQKKEFIGLIERLSSENLSGKFKKNSKSLSKQIYLLYESAVGESHLHQDDWPIKSAKKLCQQIVK